MNENDLSKILVPVLLGADLNCYHVARAFHEAYGVTSHAFGRYAIGVTQHARILTFTAVPDLDSQEGMLRTLKSFAAQQQTTLPEAQMILMGCTDDYAAMIIRNRAALVALGYHVSCIGEDLMDRITRKACFYDLCHTYGLAFPKTKILSAGNPLGKLDFPYPIIIKPSSSVLYWKHPFPGMKKVYRAGDEAEAQRIINEIYASGYPDQLILQDTIPGDDSSMYVMTAYSGQDGKVRMMCLGHVLLEEHTPKGLGNHAAVITENNPEIAEKLRRFLDDLGYVGFSNFDIKYDRRDGSYRLFEINVRQGRSNYYVTAAGFNIARLITEDLLLQKPSGPCVFCDREIYWRYIPDRIVYTYSTPEICARVRQCIREKRAFHSLHYAPDLSLNPARQIFVAMHEYRHIGKFKTYYHPEERKI